MALRAAGIHAALFRPVTLWPFPIGLLAPAIARAGRLIVVEGSAGQLEDELRLAASRAGLQLPQSIERVNRYGGALPSHDEIVERASGGGASRRGTAA